ncbi:MAG: acetyl-CoA carboxylase carboxyltransferase subunit alpha [Parachlamydiaceae bacterium]
MDILPHEKQIYEYIKTIEHLKKQNQTDRLFTSEIDKLEKKLESLKRKVYSELSPWQRVTICRHSSRPHTVDYIKNLSPNFHELCGDRSFADVQSIVGGLGTIGDMKCVIIGQEKGFDTESRIRHNFGMLNPEGFRKAMRLMKFAEKFNLPVVSLIDTPGANPRLEAEERGQAWAIAENLRDMTSLKTPIIVVVIGEGCSGGALGMAVGDVIGMLEHSYYSVISPEGCASILWKESSKKSEAAAALKLNAENMLDLHIVDAIIKEPLGGAHHDPQQTYGFVKEFILEQWNMLKLIPHTILLEQRYQKFRRMGQSEERVDKAEG